MFHSIRRALLPVGKNLHRMPTTTTTTTTANRCHSQSQLVQSTMPYPVALSLQPPEPTWKEAASLIILSQNQSAQFDYDILMVKRSSSSSFMASAFVFPGGAVELSDFDCRWYSLYARCGFNQSALECISTRIVGPRPPIVTESITLRKAKQMDPTLRLIHADIGLRISAIRETFEEAGILLLTDTTRGDDRFAREVKSTGSVDLAEWQHRVRNDSKEFLHLCDTLGMVPDIWSLFEWSDWLTPVSIGHRRFDTIFYVCCMRTHPLVKVDNAEIIKPIWVNPPDILEEHQQEQVFLAPPQVYELSRMLHFEKLDKFHQFLDAREVLGTQRWLPVIVTYDDGALSFLPGDQFYPAEPELVSARPVKEETGLVEEMNRKSKFLNRLELRGIKCHTLANINQACGHLFPITYPYEKAIVQSNL